MVQVISRISREFKRLIQCLLYMVAIRFCPAMKKKAQVQKIGAAFNSHSLKPIESSRPVDESAEKSKLNALNVFGKVFGSLQFRIKKIQSVSGREAFVYEFHETILDFTSKPVAEKPVSPRQYGRSERSLKTGFDLLRVTLNLARGDLEQVHAN